MINLEDYNSVVNIKLDQGNISGVLFKDDSIYGGDLPLKYRDYLIYSIYKNDSNSDILIGQFYRSFSEQNLDGYTYIGTLLSKYPIHKISYGSPMKLSKRDIRLLNKKLNELMEKSSLNNV